MVFPKGVIKIPDIQLEEIYNVLQKNNPFLRIANLFRLKRKDPISKKWIDSESICIEFKDQDFPKTIKFGKLIFKFPHISL